MKNIQIKKSKIGNGLFAKSNIKKDELLVNWRDGQGKEYETLGPISGLPIDVVGHAIQFDECRWIDHPEGRNINHSCEPNSGWKGSFEMVAMRDIHEGEELFLDYSTVEDSEWEMPEECVCGSTQCRKKIGGFISLPEDRIKEYMKGRYISEWLIKKYSLL